MKIFTINTVEQHAKLYQMYLENFILKYGETMIFDVETNECKMKDSYLHICSNNKVLRVCNDMDVNTDYYCNLGGLY